MNRHNKITVLTLVSLLIVSSATLWAGFIGSHKKLALLPINKDLAWHTGVSSDTFVGGSSTIDSTYDHNSLRFWFTLNDQARFPYANLALVFGESNKKTTLVNLQHYSSATLHIKCSPATTLTFSAFAFDPALSQLNNPSTFRPPTTHFSCGTEWQNIVIDLTHLEIPQWWFDKYHLNMGSSNYRLDQVSQFQFETSTQVVRNKETHVEIDSFSLSGRDERPIYIAMGLITVYWVGFGFWCFSRHKQALIEQVRQTVVQDAPEISYQQLALDLKHDKDKRTLFNYLDQHYKDSDLTPERLASAVNISRTKINDILKSNTGQTFSSYLNNRRLKEAARALSESGDIHMTDLALSLGYRNVSYFNKLFKQEYGCSPSSYKNAANSSSTTQNPTDLQPPSEDQSTPNNS